MNKSSVLKIAGILVGPLLVLIVLAYFLYPYLNEEKYQKVVEKNKSSNSQVLEDQQFEALPEPEKLELLTNEKGRLMEIIDSLKLVNKELKQKLKDRLVAEKVDSSAEGKKLAAETPSPSPEHEPGSDASPAPQQQTVTTPQQQPAKPDSSKLLTNAEVMKQGIMPQEDFSERVKSLLNLEVEELAPILDQMNTDQLIRLYAGGGSIQREKLLRSLNPEKAAKLMKEVMS